MIKLVNSDLSLIVYDGRIIMEYMGFLAPIAFVFALSAMSQIKSLKDEVALLKNKIDLLEQNNLNK